MSDGVGHACVCAVLSAGTSEIADHYLLPAREYSRAIMYRVGKVPHIYYLWICSIATSNDNMSVLILTVDF